MYRQGFALSVVLIIIAICIGVGFLLSHKTCTLAGTPPPSPPGERADTHIELRDGQFYFCRAYWERLSDKTVDPRASTTPSTTTPVQRACPDIAPACSPGKAACMKAAISLEVSYPGCSYTNYCDACSMTPAPQTP